MSEPARLQCPTCKKTVLWNDDFPHRPFCSERCQRIDFGDWATESYSIPGEPVDPWSLPPGAHREND